MDGRVEVLPDEGVMLDIPDQKVILVSTSALNKNICKLDEVLLGDVAGAEVSDPIHRHNPNVLNRTQQVLKERRPLYRTDQLRRTYFE